MGLSSKFEVFLVHFGTCALTFTSTTGSGISPGAGSCRPSKVILAKLNHLQRACRLMNPCVDIIAVFNLFYSAVWGMSCRATMSRIVFVELFVVFRVEKFFENK